MTDHNPRERWCPVNTMEQGKGSCLCGPLGLARADEREQKMAAADIAFLDAVAAREEVVALRTKMKALHKSLQMASVSAWHLDDAATLGARADGVELALGLFEERSNG